MDTPAPSYRCHRYPAEIIAHASTTPTRQPRPARRARLPGNPDRRVDDLGAYGCKTRDIGTVIAAREQIRTGEVT